MNRLIWFFGCSACGKETLIKYIYSGHDEKLNSDLNIDLSKTIILDKSIDYISKYKNDGVTDTRVEIIEDVVNLCNQHNDLTILIKGQNSDIRNSFIEQIQTRLIDIYIEIIYVFADTNILLERIRSKEWYDTSRGDTQYLESINRSLSYMRLFSNYNITYIKSNKNYKYELIPDNKIMSLSKRRKK